MDWGATARVKLFNIKEEIQQRKTDDILYRWWCALWNYWTPAHPTNSAFNLKSSEENDQKVSFKKILNSVAKNLKSDWITCKSKKYILWHLKKAGNLFGLLFDYGFYGDSFAAIFLCWLVQINYFLQQSWSCKRIAL